MWNFLVLDNYGEQIIESRTKVSGSGDSVSKDGLEVSETTISNSRFGKDVTYRLVIIDNTRFIIICVRVYHLLGEISYLVSRR